MPPEMGPSQLLQASRASASPTRNRSRGDGALRSRPGPGFPGGRPPGFRRAPFGADAGSLLCFWEPARCRRPAAVTFSEGAAARFSESQRSPAAFSVHPEFFSGFLASFLFVEPERAGRGRVPAASVPPGFQERRLILHTETRLDRNAAVEGSQILQEYVPGTRRRSRCCGESSSRDAEARGAPRSGARAAGPRGFHCPGSSVAGRDREAWKWACTHPKGASQLQSFVLAVTGDREEREASGARLQLRGLEDCRVKKIGAAFGKREKDGRQNYRFSLSRQVVESCGPGILKLGPQHSQWNNHHKATEAREMNSRIFFHIGKEMNSRIFSFTSAREPNSRIFLSHRVL
ncbi:uncharacterized protein [Excalfactoria chinensis]|uniref:uncharacterized protein n=1 Tax=Excalfactoria chinensis TaxID=46218 RepID=UPI003B3B3DD5